MFSATSFRAVIAFGIVACASPLHYNMNAATNNARHNIMSASSTSTSSYSSESTILRRSTPQQTTTERYYATWNPTQLCGQKSTFDAWEESYESLEECCEMKFSWDYDACMASEKQ